MKMAYTAGVQDERERLRLLAEAVLEAHNLPEEWQTAHQCSACKVAREVMGCKHIQS